MEIIDSNFYAISEIQKIVDWDSRRLQRYAKKNDLKMIDRRYIFTGVDVKEIIKTNDIVTTKQNKKSIDKKTVATVPKDIIKLILDIDNDVYIRAMLVAIKEDKHIEQFSEEEYIQLQKQLTDATKLAERILEYKEEITRMDDYVKDYRNNIEYLKKSLDKRAEETEILLKSVIQRNVIEASDKGINTK